MKQSPSESFGRLNLICCNLQICSKTLHLRGLPGPFFFKKVIRVISSSTKIHNQTSFLIKDSTNLLLRNIHSNATQSETDSIADVFMEKSYY